MKRAVTAGKRFQDECFEEPAGMGQVPLGRTYLRHGLQAEVLVLKCFAQGQRGLPYMCVGSQGRIVTGIGVMRQPSHSYVGFLLEELVSEHALSILGKILLWHQFSNSVW
jgi:hypothetical protein